MSRTDLQSCEADWYSSAGPLYESAGENCSIWAHNKPMRRTTPLQQLGRILLGAAMIFAGTGHLTFARQDFQAQVPDALPLDKDFVVLASGLVEIGLGAALLALPEGKPRRTFGQLLAAFFVAVFPGNIAQYLGHKDAFGLDTDQKRLIRLFFQPLLVLWALWSTGSLGRKRD